MAETLTTSSQANTGAAAAPTPPHGGATVLNVQNAQTEQFSTAFDDEAQVSGATLPQPVSIDPTATVETTYQTGAGAADTASNKRLGKYLADRFDPPQPQRTRWAVLPGAVPIPVPTRYTAEPRLVTRHERDGWWIRPRTAVAVTLAGLALANVIGNAPALIGDAKDVAASVRYDYNKKFNPPKSQQVTTPVTHRVPGKTEHFSVKIDSVNAAASDLVSAPKVNKIVSQMEQAKKSNVKLSEIIVTGRSSDEWGGDDSIGKREGPDQDFSGRRADTYAKVIRAKLKAAGIKAKVITATDQSVLSKQQKSRLSKLVHKNGYDSITSAISDVEDGGSVDPAVKKAIKQSFIDKRGVTIEAKGTKAGKTTTTETTTTQTMTPELIPPANPDRDYRFIPFLIPPIPRFRRLQELKTKPGIGLRPSAIGLPGISKIKQDLETAWVRVRKEAILKDGTLIAAPWAYTRKFEHLLRERRIQEVLVAHFTPIPNEQPSTENPVKEPAEQAALEPAALRVMFIDHTPTAETVEAFSGLLAKFTAMQNGAIARKISGIFVYPADHAGTSHGDIKKIALGIDEQDSRAVLGTCTPILELVEMQMAAAKDSGELQAELEGFMGPLFTMAHEVAGHGTSITDAKLVVKRAFIRGIRKAHVLVNDHWNDVMSRVTQPLRPLANETPARPVEFDITEQVDHADHSVITPLRVTKDDPRLSGRTDAVIAGFQPTVYAGAQSLEHYAETAAAVTTGYRIPFTETNIAGSNILIENGKPLAVDGGFIPDRTAQRVFTDTVGAIPYFMPTTFQANRQPDVRFELLKPHEDELLAAQSRRARSSRIPRPGQMKAILARFAR